MKKSIFTLLALAALALCGTAVHAARSESDPGKPAAHQRKFKPGQFKKALNLSDEQAAQIKTHLVAHKDALRSEARKVHAARASLRTAIQSGASEADLRAAATAIGAAEGDFALARANLFAQIKPILTPEQLAKLQSMQALHARL